MTVFAAPPNVSYVTCIAATPTGTLFIGIDEDGSLGLRRERDASFAPLTPNTTALPISSTSSPRSIIRAG